MSKVLTLDEVRVMAIGGDVSHVLRDLGYMTEETNTEESLKILRLGYRNEAVNWLESATPNGLLSGIWTKDKRLAEAELMAELAGTTLEQVARESGLLSAL